jgi:methylated-DNA-[protein]-cysteine S-methyltransferase
MSGQHAYTLFATRVGTCGIAWGEGGVVGLSLPAATEAETARRMERAFDAARQEPPAFVADIVAQIGALLAGDAQALDEVPLDMTGVPDFHRQVYAVARGIPPGKTLTYGDVAHRLGQPGAARAVGQALGQNPFPIVVPCHRVLGAGEKIGGFSAPGGRETKLRLLALEGLDLRGGPSLFEHAGLAL